MSEHTERFTGRVAEYARYRRPYPAEKILKWLRTECGLRPEWRVADVAAGTGMLTEVFLGNGNPVVAVEPNAEMRQVGEGLRAEWPEMRVAAGTAEATGLEAGSVEMVTAGRAFHWFEPVAAAVEFRRVLVPGGWVVLVSSGRKKEETERAQELESVLMEHGTDYAHVRDRYRRRDRMEAFFSRLAGVEEVRPSPTHRRVEFEEEQVVGWEEFAGGVQSMSVAPLPGSARYDGMQRALEQFFARWSEDGELRVVEVCSVDVGQVE